MNVARVDGAFHFLRVKLPIPTVGDAPHQSFSFKFATCEFGDS